ncbi:MurR/RpiR family transcriptional regulator [Rosenbergiella collisarenosi]|uniref:MurR/RpiR family transcriptional regulator n=1 Tax=Rosenbergiella collisarenosi TaxID=1544695 RepID=UPI001BD992B8|nr:MurR/RpiR family transcriptional regulator [Rosenbergiella collisarenosi]MBT0722657.1 MurR/RpiR family transcriptional regulator [Rosenbergiella collisarenosi]
MIPLNQRLASQYDSLTPQEKRVADFVVDHFDDLISYNSAELARVSGVSKATVSRLFKRLGYEKYKDMYEELRVLRQSGMPLTEPKDIVHGDTLLARHYKQEMANLLHWTTHLQADEFAAAINAINQARHVGVVGYRNAYPVALHLRAQLIQTRAQVSLFPTPGQTLSEELVDYGPQDVVIVIAFRRRPAVIKKLLLLLQGQGVKVVTLSEPQALSIQGLATWQFATPLESVSAFDCYGAAMSFVTLLANALLHSTLETGRQRIHKIAESYQALEELEQR